MQLTTFSLKPKAPFSFEHSLEVLGAFRADGLSRLVTRSRLIQAFRVLNRTLVVELYSTGDLERPQLACRAWSSSPPTEDELKRLKNELSFYLSLADDLTPFYARAQQDEAFRPLLERLYGYHLVKFPTLFCCACWALVTQRTPNRFAFKTMTRLCELLGDGLEQDGFRYTTFPAPARFFQKGASAKVLEATNNTRKTERLLAIARSFVKADETFLRSAAFDEAAAWLKGLHGLGQWSVDYIMLRGLGRSERTPWTDTRILDAISSVYTRGLSISRGDARALAESYGWYQGYWAHYLKTLDWLDR